jgi:DNA-binding CsgD family transcriptional regulator
MSDSREAPLGFGSVELLIDAMVKSLSLADFCRAIVHSELSRASTQGCHIFSLGTDAKLKVVSGYGLECPDTPDALSVWDEHPVSDCVRYKVVKFQGADHKLEQGLLAIPLLKDSIPIGALALVVDKQVRTAPINESLMPILSKLGTYVLSTMAAKVGWDQSGGFSERKEFNGEELTSRQLRILNLMADGMVNAEIAKELMVSESTVRQETVRIYRALGVPNRFDASKKARALGLIKRLPSVSASSGGDA